MVHLGRMQQSMWHHFLGFLENRRTKMFLPPNLIYSAARTTKKTTTHKNKKMGKKLNVGHFNNEKNL